MLRRAMQGERWKQVGGWGRLLTCAGLLTRPANSGKRHDAPVANRRAGCHPAPHLDHEACDAG